MERFDLKNGALRLTEQPGLAYRVETGRVLVFLMPWREKKTGRRFLLAEVGPGALVPSLCWEDDVQGSWIFGLSALEEASLTCWRLNDIIQLQPFVCSYRHIVGNIAYRYKPDFFCVFFFTGIGLLFFCAAFLCFSRCRFFCLRLTAFLFISAGCGSKSHAHDQHSQNCFFLHV